MQHKGIKKFEDEKYADAMAVTESEPEKERREALERDTALYELPAVLRDPGGGWGLYMLTIRGGRVLSKLRLHGPDLRRVCLAKAIRILER